MLCGDFFQLPPVGIGRGSTRFCFEARTWDTSIDQSIVLKQVGLAPDFLLLEFFFMLQICLWCVQGWIGGGASGMMNTGNATELL